MNPAWLDSTVAWIGAHPHAAGLLVFLVAFCDALAVVGIVVPALPLLFAVGALVGLGHIDGTYAVTCAALGALAGDGLSYWVGYRWGPRLREVWPHDTKFQKRCFELLRAAYVKARYSRHYRITDEELAYLTERIEVLRQVVAKASETRLAALRAAVEPSDKPE